MSKITIDGKEYDPSELPEDAKQQLASLQFADSELKRLAAQVAVFKTARNVYLHALKTSLNSEDNAPGDELIDSVGENITFE